MAASTASVCKVLASAAVDAYAEPQDFCGLPRSVSTCWRSQFLHCFSFCFSILSTAFFSFLAAVWICLIRRFNVPRSDELSTPRPCGSHTHIQYKCELSRLTQDCPPHLQLAAVHLQQLPSIHMSRAEFWDVLIHVESFQPLTHLLGGPGGQRTGRPIRRLGRSSTGRTIKLTSSRNVAWRNPGACVRHLVGRLRQGLVRVGESAGGACSWRGRRRRKLLTES